MITSAEVSDRVAATVDWGLMLARAPENGEAYLASLLRESIDNAPVGITILDREQIYLYTNETLARFNGVTAAQMVGRASRDVVPEVFDAAHLVVQRVFDTGRPVRGFVFKAHTPHQPDVLREYETDYKPLINDGAVVAVAAIVREITEERRAQREAAEWRERYEAAVRAAGQLLFDWELTSDVIVCAGEAELVTGYPVETVSGPMEEFADRIVHPDDRAGLVAEIERVRATGEALEASFRIVRADGAIAWCDARGHCVRDREGRAVRMIGLIADVTERHQAEERQQLLLHELNHRVKNTLTVVQSVARRTLHGVPDAEGVLKDFSGRLQALSAVHALLTDTSWRGAQLYDLIEAQAGPYAGNRLSLDGPQLRLEPDMAQMLALVCHELATNAAKYGALSGPEGEVAVAWNVEDRRLRLRWEERGGPPIEAPPQRRGFGSTLIKNTLERAHGGQVRLDYRRQGLRCDIELPLGAPVG